VNACDGRVNACDGRVNACDRCLRRSALIALLVPRIATILEQDRRRVPEVLALGEHDLIAAVAGDLAPRARRLLDEFDAAAARRRVADAGLFSACGHVSGYPDLLRHQPDAPAVLYGTGPADRFAALAAEPAVALVGTRRASAYGLEVAGQLGRGLSTAGVTVVSGMALGVDAAAHRGALAAGGGTIAVLAGGPERASPRANRPLYERIVQAGTVIAELPPGTGPRKWTFPARNRIMAALAQVTIVVEGAQRSGSLITAGFAAQIGRGVGAVPGRVTARMASGANDLLYDGAQVIRGPEDVLDMLFGAGGGRDRSPAPCPADPALEDPERQVLAAIEAGRSPEHAGDGAGLGPGEVRAALGRLEVLGLVRRDGLGAYERVAGP
jgi:DNA processing protein